MKIKASRLLAAILSLAMLTLLFAGCGKTLPPAETAAPAVTPTAAPEPTQAPPPEEEEIVYVPSYEVYPPSMAPGQVNFPLERPADSLDADVTKEYDEAGIVLSGGEKQKLALARLFCADLGLLLLDEPSAALEPLAEYELMQSLMFLAEDKTVVMVAHRLSTVRHMDRILVIDRGRLAEEGTHEELMARNGIYAEMFRKQGENYVA